MKYRIALIIPYFGLWPDWIELYMYSCGRNSMLDFIFYTDCPLPKHVYQNTKFHICSFDEYKKKVSDRLGINYNIKSAYKLTDLKPFLGAIHEEDLKDYDFWGFGDIDLVYGDLSIVINENNLKRYDIITTHNYHIAGHFTLCKNNEYYRNCCFKIKNWKDGLKQDKHYGYDESAWSDLIYPSLKWIRAIHKRIFKPLGVNLFTVLNLSNTILSGRRMFIEFWTTPNPEPEGTMVPQWCYKLNTGEINKLGTKISLPYLHFLFFKKTPWLETDFYWRDGYYQIEDDFEKYNMIIFDYQKIQGLI